MTASDCKAESKVKSLRYTAGIPAFYFSVLVFAVSACAPARPQYRQAAPTKQSETGIIVQLNSEQDEVNLLEAYPKAQIRSLHQNTRLVEVFNVTETEIRETVSAPRFLKHNVYMKNMIRQTAEPENAVEAYLKECKKSPTGPKAQISTTAGLTRAELDGEIVDRSKIFAGQLPLTSALTASTVQDPTTLDYMWLVLAPEESDLAYTMSVSSQITLKPDLLGGYSVILFAKDKLKNCSQDTIEFGITESVPFKGAKPARAFASSDREMFKHLGQIHVEQAWGTSKGKGVKIAIVDTGVNYNHPDLSANISINSKEIPGNQIDDDKNGLVDDTNGWNFVADNNMPSDDQRHGTHCAGLAASAVTGIAPNAQIIPVKVLNAMGGGDVGSIIAGIMYAADLGADVISLSLGSYVPKQEMHAAVLYAQKKGALVVAASGNGDPETGKGMDSDVFPNFPSSFADPGILAVGAAALDGSMSSYSNYGIVSVDLVAPGGDESDGGVYSTFMNYDKKMYIQLSGTSMATPVTAGLAALVKAANPKLTALQVKEILMSTVDVTPALKGKLVSGGIINAERAVLKAKAPVLAPPAIALAD